MKRADSTLLMSIFALLVSGLSLVISFQNRQYSRLMSFEQRKQETRQLLFEIRFLFEYIEQESLEMERTAKTAELQGRIIRIRDNARDSLDDIDKAAELIKSLEAVPNTRIHLQLETLYSEMQLLKKKAEAQLDELRAVKEKW
jgi:hypothetical protein